MEDTDAQITDRRPDYSWHIRQHKLHACCVSSPPPSLKAAMWKKSSRYCSHSGLGSQLRNSELRQTWLTLATEKDIIFIVPCEKNKSAFSSTGGTISIFQAVHYTNIFENLAHHKSYRCFCSQSMWKCERPTENYLPRDSMYKNKILISTRLTICSEIHKILKARQYSKPRMSTFPNYQVWFSQVYQLTLSE